MSFRDIATPLIKRGICVVPVDPGAKRCRLPGWPQLATVDPDTIARWNDSNPGANVGCVAKNESVCMIDCDVAGVPEFIEAATGQKLPRTYTVVSAGRRCPHLYFSHTDASRALGNRSLPGRFDFKAHNSYVVGPGSVLQTEGGPRSYDEQDDAPIAPIPDWLVAWIASSTTTEGTAAGSCRGARGVTDAFDFAAFCEHYGITGHQKGPWFITDVCPVAGHKHEQSTETGFYWDGETFGWKCFASGCAGCGMTVGDVIRFLNNRIRRSATGGLIAQAPFPADIWQRADEDDRAPEPLPAEVMKESWLVDFRAFNAKVIPPRKRLLWDHTSDATVLYSESVNQVFATRGLGKSVFAVGLTDCLLHGGKFLNYESKGGLKVLYCDGELPDALLQKRFRDQIKRDTAGRLQVMNASTVPGDQFPQLSQVKWQSPFVSQIAAFKPDVIVFDTLSACFRFDTLKQDAWDIVNQFYIALRRQGYCVLVVNHSGKDETRQRGISNADDNLDLSILLKPVSAWEPGDGCKFKLSYDKVREGGRLSQFVASFNDGVWIVEDPTKGDPETAEIIKLWQEGGSVRGIQHKVGCTKHAVERAIKQARESGLVDEPKAKGKRGAK